jgi:hypothetical protein
MLSEIAIFQKDNAGFLSYTESRPKNRWRKMNMKGGLFHSRGPVEGGEEMIKEEIILSIL